MSTTNRFATLETERRRLQEERAQLQAVTAKATKQAQEAMREAIKMEFAERVAKWGGHANPDEELTFIASLNDEQRRYYVNLREEQAAEFRQAGISAAHDNPAKKLADLVAAHMERTGEKSRIVAAREVMAKHPGLTQEARLFSEIGN